MILCRAASLRKGNLGKEGKGMSQGTSPRKSIPGRGNSECKGPEAEAVPAGSQSSRWPTMAKQCEQKRREEMRSERQWRGWGVGEGDHAGPLNRREDCGFLNEMDTSKDIDIT